MGFGKSLTAGNLDNESLQWGRGSVAAETMVPGAQATFVFPALLAAPGQQPGRGAGVGAQRRPAHHIPDGAVASRDEQHPGPHAAAGLTLAHLDVAPPALVPRHSREEASREGVFDFGRPTHLGDAAGPMGRELGR